MSDFKDPQNPVLLLRRALRLWLGRRVHFRKDIADSHLVDAAAPEFDGSPRMETARC